MPFVFDSYALLAHLGGEPGAQRVREILEACAAGSERGYVSQINVGECLYIVHRERDAAQAARVLGIIDQLPLQQLPATRPRILAAAHVTARHRVSYADAFVVAAASEHGATILTGDPEFHSVEGEVKIDWLPRP